jgi:hypothetical protein
MSAAEINLKIIDQGNKIRDLKSAKADKNAIKTEVDTLLALKGEFKKVYGSGMFKKLLPISLTGQVKSCMFFMLIVSYRIFCMSKT